jgi:hypothetical protein
MKPIRTPIFIALAFVTLAAALRFWIGPGSKNLPVDYANETDYEQENQFRDSPDADWQTSQLNVWRVDHALTASNNAIIIQGDLHIYSENGEVNFETNGLYGVDRKTRENLPEYGSEQRSGQYFLPAPVMKTAYTLWDPFYIGPQALTFDHADMLEGLPVYVFTFLVVELNETAGYSYLSIVPEHYLAHSTAQGTLWVEPLSGIVVNYQDQGVSSFVDPSSGEPVADFNRWTNIYTSETRTAQLEMARVARLRILALEVWLPGAFVIISLIWLAFGLIKTRQFKGRRG